MEWKNRQRAKTEGIPDAICCEQGLGAVLVNPDRIGTPKASSFEPPWWGLLGKNRKFWHRGGDL
ncbi:MAG: hypothetical protein ACYTEL_26710 [Planctomycetota bacterium]